MIGKLTVATLTIFGVIASLASPTYAQSEREKICAEAWDRYKTLELEADYKAQPGEAVVLQYKYNFCPMTMTVKKGTTVRWINVDKRTSHSVWLKEKGDKESPRFFPDESWIYVADESGKFPYLCGPHWKQEGMVGTLIVE